MKDSSLNPTQKSDHPARRWLTMVAVFLVACMTMMASVVYVADPFMYYRTPKTYIFYDARYCLAGLLKNEKYDTVFVGSSMLQNTDPTIVSKVGWKAMKATCSAACPSDIKLLVNYALKWGKPKRVVVAIDYFYFLYPPNFTRAQMPTYLYDNNIWNDGMYWFNNNVWMNLFPKELLDASKRKNPLDLNTIDDWQSKYTFSRAAVLASVAKIDYDGIPPKSKLKQMEATFDATVYSIAAAHPDVEFYLLYPPYSVLAWYGSANHQNLLDTTAFKEYIAEHRLANMRLFDFQDLGSLITNLDNYKDDRHYSIAINDYMVECILSGRNEVKSARDQKQRNQNQINIVSQWKLIR